MIQVGGLLNPEFCEWLMGVPIGWTDLKPLATELFREWYESFCDAAEGEDLHDTTK